MKSDSGYILCILILVLLISVFLGVYGKNGSNSGFFSSTFFSGKSLEVVRPEVNV